MKSITIYSGHSLDNAYSSILYLKKELEKYCVVSLWSNSEGKAELFGENCKTFMKTWYTNIPKIRFVIKLIHVFFLMLFGNKNIIVNDLDFYIPAYYAKKIRRSLVVIHYNTEIHGTDVKYRDFIEKFYEKHANFPDMIIECLDERASYRKEKFSISKNIEVINNTCMCESVESYIKKEKDSKYVNDDLIRNRKVLVYAGSCEAGIDLERIIDVVSKRKDELFFLGFCYGKKESVDNLTQICANTLDFDDYRLYSSIPRDELLNVLYHYGDIGVVYYDPDKSINYYYASPSKLFEYMAMGLNIISTNNRGINTIIESNNIGKCFENNEKLEETLLEMLNMKLLDKKSIIELFKSKYCYEVDCVTCVENILSVIN